MMTSSAYRPDPAERARTCEHRREGIVALSDEEQRVLAEIEHALAADDPSLAHTIESGRPRSRILAVLPPLGLLCGIALVIIGLLGTNGVHIATSVFGFAVVVVACMAVVNTHRRRYGKFFGGGHR